MERFHSRGQQPCTLIATKEIFYIKTFSSQDWFGTSAWLPFHCFGGNTNMVDVTSCENGGVFKTFPRCISTKYLAGNCDSNKLFHKGTFDRLYSRIRLYADICDKFLWTQSFGPFQCYLHLNCLFPPKFLILPCIWSQTRFFQSLFHLFWFRNTFNRTSRWLRAFIPLIPVPPDKGKADSDCGIHDSVYEVPAA